MPWLAASAATRPPLPESTKKPTLPGLPQLQLSSTGGLPVLVAQSAGLSLPSMPSVQVSGLPFALAANQALAAASAVAARSAAVQGIAQSAAVGVASVPGQQVMFPPLPPPLPHSMAADKPGSVQQVQSVGTQLAATARAAEEQPAAEQPAAAPPLPQSDETSSDGIAQPQVQIAAGPGVPVTAVLA